MSTGEPEMEDTSVLEEVASLKTQMNKIMEMLGALTAGRSLETPQPRPGVLEQVQSYGPPLTAGPDNPAHGPPGSFVFPSRTQTETSQALFITYTSQPIPTQPTYTFSTTMPTTMPIPSPTPVISVTTGQPIAEPGAVRQGSSTQNMSSSGYRVINNEAFRHAEGFVHHHEDDQEAPPSRQMYRLLEERLKMVEKGGDSTLKDLSEFYLVTDFVLPPDFKVPTFPLFNGFGCPNEHLTLYLRRMASYSSNDKLLIHCFQESLSGAATKWYNSLERSQVPSFKELAEAFVRQYRYNTKSAPTRMRLQAMSMKKDEPLRDYAQRWRMVASQVEPPLSETEMISTFVRTLQNPYYEKLIGVVALTYADMITIGERIEEGIQMGKVEISSSSGAKKMPARKKEGDVHAVGQFKPQQALALPAPAYKPNAQPQYKAPPPVPLSLPAPPQGRPPAPEKKKVERVYTPIPMTYAALLPDLLKCRLVELLPAKEVHPPFSRAHDPNARCAFHSGMVGHSTENCISLRNKVQKLIDEQWLNFNGATATTSSNPLPQHGAEVTAIEGQNEEFEIATVGEEGGTQGKLFVTQSQGSVQNWEMKELAAAVYGVTK